MRAHGGRGAEPQATGTANHLPSDCAKIFHGLAHRPVLLDQPSHDVVHGRQLVAVLLGIPLVESEDVVPTPRLRLCCLREDYLVAGGGNEVDRYVNLVLGCPLVDQSLQHRIGRRYPVIPDAHRQLASGGGCLNMHQRQGRADGASRDLQRLATGDPMDTCHGLLLPVMRAFHLYFLGRISDASGTQDAYLRPAGQYTGFDRLLSRCGKPICLQNRPWRVSFWTANPVPVVFSDRV